ncbi:MAG: hypothetical protein QOF02_3021 [Blastocatellia bacterium]|jgi:hypothetical protein|nr:hypothetical protein [Blastocatellia bacterium]
MKNRRTILTVVAAALIALCLPVLASAQGSYGRNDGYNGRYDARTLRDAARRVSDRSRDFQRHLDSALDRSRYDDTRREDRINDAAQEFRNAAINFKDRIGDGRNLNRGVSEVRQLLQIATRVERFVGRTRLDARSASDWSQIRQDLRLIADAYGINFNGGGGIYRNDDDGRRNDDRNRGRDNDPRQQRFPRP